MTSTPPPGWDVHVLVPSSQQQAQDTVLGYLRKTLAALPPGTVIDATRYGGAGSNSPCGEAPNDSSELFSATGDLRTVADMDAKQVVALIGETWKSWGWNVVEQEGKYKPNRSGYSPDGYELHVETPGVPGPPSVIGNSPCFPHSLVQDDLPFPLVVTAG